VRACDICGKHEGMPGVEILKANLELDDERVRADVCREDAQPLLECMKKIPAAQRRRTARHDFSASMVDDPAEIPRESV
jgi:hypothetical protein